MVVGGMCMTRGHAWWHGDVHGHGGVHCSSGMHGWGCVRDWGAGVACPPPRGYREIRTMSGRYTSYWNAFLLYFKSCSDEERIEFRDVKDLNTVVLAHSVAPHCPWEMCASSKSSLWYESFTEEDRSKIYRYISVGLQLVA